MEFNSEISGIDKMNILFRTGAKFIRGFWKRLFLKKATGLFLVGKHVQISHGKHIICGKNVKFEDYAEIHGLCSDGLVFGDYVTISRGVMIRSSSYYGGDYGQGLVIEENSSIGPYGYVGCSGKIKIGKNVMFGPKCCLFAENHVFSDSKKDIKSQGVKQKGITIEDDCWIGSNVTILDGVTIGKGCVIGADTLISKDVPPGSVLVDKRTKIFRERSRMNPAG
ncbi:acyltransferase [Robinsoniella peoriensis]|uniref:acyltransferase n=1 Tax=Robinsoniella peoriensis TaxID=180332 RepID=UPI003752E7F5